VVRTYVYTYSLETGLMSANIEHGRSEEVDDVEGGNTVTMDVSIDVVDSRSPHAHSHSTDSSIKVVGANAAMGLGMGMGMGMGMSLGLATATPNSATHPNTNTNTNSNGNADGIANPNANASANGAEGDAEVDSSAASDADAIHAHSHSHAQATATGGMQEDTCMAREEEEDEEDVDVDVDVERGLDTEEGYRHRNNMSAENTTPIPSLEHNNDNNLDVNNNANTMVVEHESPSLADSPEADTDKAHVHPSHSQSQIVNALAQDTTLGNANGMVHEANATEPRLYIQQQQQQLQQQQQQQQLQSSATNHEQRMRGPSPKTSTRVIDPPCVTNSEHNILPSSPHTNTPAINNSVIASVWNVDTASLVPGQVREDPAVVGNTKTHEIRTTGIEPMIPRVLPQHTLVATTDDLAQQTSLPLHSQHHSSHQHPQQQQHHHHHNHQFDKTASSNPIHEQNHQTLETHRRGEASSQLPILDLIAESRKRKHAAESSSKPVKEPRTQAATEFAAQPRESQENAADLKRPRFNPGEPPLEAGTLAPSQVPAAGVQTPVAPTLKKVKPSAFFPSSSNFLAPSASASKQKPRTSTPPPTPVNMGPTQDLINRDFALRALNLGTAVALGSGSTNPINTKLALWEKAGISASAIIETKANQSFDLISKIIMASVDSNKPMNPDLYDPTDFDVDSVARIVCEIHKLLEYLVEKPKLVRGSASFIRDYLRTMLVVASDQSWIMNVRQELQSRMETKNRESMFNQLPREISKHIFSFLDGKNLARVRQVCKSWEAFANDEQVWKKLCLKEWRSLSTDAAAWRLVDSTVSLNDEHKWRKIYPSLVNNRRWRCRLQKTGRFICHMIAHQVAGAPLSESSMPETLVVERRFNILHLQTFVLPDAAVLYFEPESEKDRPGFEDFIDYLTKRTRAGLALDDQRRFIFIPPCDYSREHLDYSGTSLLGVVQLAYPPLAS